MNGPKRRWVGTSVLRAEDPRLVAGGGNYLEDLTPHDALSVAVFRSPVAHARITRLDLTAALAAPGVRRIITADDLGPGDASVPVIWQMPGMLMPTYRPLARGVVRHVGEPIAAIVADDRYRAEDALDLITLEYEALPVVVDARRALEPDAPILHEQLATNEAYHLELRRGDPDAAFRSADLVIEENLAIQRHTGVPMERRGTIAAPGLRPGELTIWSTIQHPHLYRRDIAPLLGIPESQLRVIAPDVGGAFGVYYQIYPEDIIVGRLALMLNRPIKWVEDRRETFLNTIHARQQDHRARLAVRRDGRILALADDIVSDIGAYLDYSGIGPSYFTANLLTGVYDIQAVDVRLRCAFTNKVRGGAYRGFGAPQGVFVMERLLDIAAHRLGMDPHEIRRRNFIREDQFPYETYSGWTIDYGRYESLLAKAEAVAGFEELKAMQRAARADGRKVGIGTAVYTEHTGTGPSKSLAKRGYMVGGYERATVRVGNDGSIVVQSGASHIGQGIRTGLAQLVADALGVRPEQIEVVTGDTGLVPHGNRGSIGSRSAVIAGQAAQNAALEVRAQALRVAAHLLEAAIDDMVVEGGRFHVVGSTDRSLGYAELGRAAQMRHAVPDDVEPALEATATFDPSTHGFASAVHLVAVEVDPETGWLKILKYVIVHDCGTLINPMIVDGQVMGGAAQGIGGALLEEIQYDDQGQILTVTLADYLLPTAMDIPGFVLDHEETPATWLATGVKGAGEGGTLGPGAALANAASDALGVELNRTPLTPERLWRALDARSTSTAD